MPKSHLKSGKKYSSSEKSKGERLGWVSIKDAKPVKLREILSEGEVVVVANDKQLLVP